MFRNSGGWLTAATVLVITGVIVFSAAMTACGWDFARLSPVKLETNTYEVTEAFRDISIDFDTTDILFVPSEDGKCRVICHEAENVKHSVNVRDDVLGISEIDGRKWYHHIGIAIGTPKVTVCLTEEAYGALTIEGHTGGVELPADFRFESIDVSASTGDVSCLSSASGTVKIKTSTGSISVENISADALDLSVTTGRVNVLNADCGGDMFVDVTTGKTSIIDTACRNFVSKGSTGAITLKNVIAVGKFSIERSTGNVQFDGCDAAEIFVRTDTGDVAGSLLTDKVFVTKTGTGRINVPDMTVGGRCEVTTSTGNIRLNIE